MSPSQLAALALVSLALPARAASPVATYELQSSFAAAEAGVPALVPVDPQGESRFTTDTALGQVRTVWSFNGAGSPADQQAGLTLEAAGLIPPHTYSVDFVAKLTDLAGAYRRLIDVQNRRSDNGFYIDPSNNLRVYPAGGTTAAWTNGVYHHVVVTTDGTTVNAYLDGVSQFTSTTNLLNLDYDPTNNPAQLMGFFLDNVAGGGQGEWSRGAVAFIRLWEGVLTPEEAHALAANPFATTTVAITSPPADIQLVAGDPVTVAAEASAGVSEVRFSLDDAPLGTVAAPGPYVFAFTVPAAGPHQVSAVAVNGRETAQRSSAFRSVDPAVAGPAPSVDFLTDANDRALAAGSAFTLAASAFANREGEELERVDFYADGAVFASFDGTGAPLGDVGRPGRREALANGAVFKAAFQLPGVSKLVNLVAVALTRAGVARVSAPVTVQSVANAADRPPTVRISGLANGARVTAATLPRDIQVEVSDPDAAARAIRGGPVRRAFDVSPIIARVQYYLNSLLVKDSKEAPFTLPLTASAPGTYVLTAIATDGAGLAAISEPVQVEAVAAPSVTIAVKGASVLREGGAKGKAVITRTGETGEALTVYLKLKGTAVNGVDYQETPAVVTIPAGAETAKVKLRSINDAVDRGPRSIKVQLLPAPGSEYTLTAVRKAKFTLTDDD